MKNIEQFMTTESADQHIAEVEAIVNKAYELHVPARETNTFWGLKNDMVTVQRRHIAKLHAHLANKYVLDWLTDNLPKWDNKILNARFFNALRAGLHEYTHALQSHFPVLRFLFLSDWKGWRLEVSYLYSGGRHTSYASATAYAVLDFNKFVHDRRLVVNKDFMVWLDELKRYNQQAIDNLTEALYVGAGLETVERVFMAAVKTYNQFNEFKDQLGQIYQDQIGGGLNGPLIIPQSPAFTINHYLLNQ